MDFDQLYVSAITDVTSRDDISEDLKDTLIANRIAYLQGYKRPGDIMTSILLVKMLVKSKELREEEIAQKMVHLTSVI